MTYNPADLAAETPWEGWDTSQDMPPNPGALTPTPTLPQQAGTVPGGGQQAGTPLVIDMPGAGGGRGGGSGPPPGGYPPIPPPPQSPGQLPYPAPQPIVPPQTPSTTMPPQQGPGPNMPGGGSGVPPTPAPGPVGKPKQPANQTLVDRILDLVTGKTKQKNQEGISALLKQAMEQGAKDAAAGRPAGAPEGKPIINSDYIRQLLASGQQQPLERTPYVVPGGPISGRQYPGQPLPQAAPQGMPQGRPQGVLRMMRGGYPFQYLSTSPGLPIREMARGGSRQSYVPGDGNSGRSDQVKAMLSPNEYVIDAETVALLGDGSPDHGAKKLDKFRNNIRQHKGKALAKGKISSDARQPESYLR